MDQAPASCSGLSESVLAADLQKLKLSCRKETGDDGAGPFADPVFKKIARFNGEVNKMTKDEIKAKLQELRLDTRGHKDVLKKRLKNYYKQKNVKRSAVRTAPKTRRYDYFIVIDFEATCDHNAVRYPHEIIEFPAVLVSATDGTKIDEFHSYVRPTQNASLTEYCTQLTGITQDKVDSAPTFEEVLKNMEIWMMHHHLGGGKKFAVVTDGPWDMGRFMYLQCRTSKIPFPQWASRWVNIRKTFCNSYSLQRASILTMLENLGLSFEGRQHCGLDDARNIANILAQMIKDKCDVYVNERLYKSKMSTAESCSVAQSDSTCDPEVLCVRKDDSDSADGDDHDDDIIFSDVKSADGAKETADD